MKLYVLEAILKAIAKIDPDQKCLTQEEKDAIEALSPEDIEAKINLAKQFIYGFKVTDGKDVIFSKSFLPEFTNTNWKVNRDANSIAYHYIANTVDGPQVDVIHYLDIDKITEVMVFPGAYPENYTIPGLTDELVVEMITLNNLSENIIKLLLKANNAITKEELDDALSRYTPLSWVKDIYTKKELDEKLKEILGLGDTLGTSDFVRKDELEELLKGLTQNIGNQKGYIYEQEEPSNTWTIEHNLDKTIISVLTLDTLGRQIIGMCDYAASDENTLVIRFSQAVAGKAFI